jgi:Sec-independent protein translocase protein TatA
LIQFIFLAFFTLSSYSAEFLITPLDSTNVDIGETIQVRWQIRFSESESIRQLNVLKFRNQKINGNIYLSNFYIDNRDVENEYSGTTSITLIDKNFKTKKFKIDGREYELSFQGFEFGDLATPNPRGYLVASQELTTNRNFYFIYIIIFNIIALIVLYSTKLRKHLRNKRQQLKQFQKERKEKKEILVLIEQARDRSSIELIYQKRDKVFKTFPGKSEMVEDVMNIINSIQYKRDWSNLELDRIKEKISYLTK